MPSRFIIKVFEGDAYYHVFNRGVNKRAIFLDEWDFEHFIKILRRHLDPADTQRKSDGTTYTKLDKELELASFCLMSNHFHLLFRQLGDKNPIERLMRSVLTAYVMYFNKKYSRVGPLFQSIYKASRISSDAYLLHISRYIHMNPRNYQTYRWSSLADYTAKRETNWLKPKSILELFEGDNYLAFLEDYEPEKELIEEVKYELASTS